MADETKRQKATGFPGTPAETLRRKRSAVLHQMQLLGIDTADWGRVDAYCTDRRIAGKRFCVLDAEELDALLKKLRAIRRKKDSPKQ